MDFSDILTSEVIQAFIGIVSVLLTYTIHRLSTYIKTKTNNEKMNYALSLIDNILTVAVKQMEQTSKKQLIKASKNGKLTASQKRILRHKAVDIALCSLTYATQKEVMKVIPDLRDYAFSKVEGIVHDIKISKYSGNTTNKILDTAIAPAVEITIDRTINAVKDKLSDEILNNFDLNNK